MSSGETELPAWPTFYEVEVNGEKFVDWVTRLIEGEPVDDVHCQKCRVG